MSERFIHTYPNALLIFLKGFNSIPQNPSELLMAQNIEGEVEEISNLSVELTVKNSPGSFSATIVDKANKFIIPDDPEKEIPIFYKASANRKIYTSVNQKTDTNQVQEGFLVGAPVIEKSESNKVQNSANYYPFRTYNDWLEHEHGSLFDESIGETYIVYSSMNSAGQITERWAFDKDGNVIIIDVWDTIRNMEQHSYKVLDVTNGKKFIVKKYKNKDFILKYKDTEEQGFGQSEFKKGRCKISPMDRVVIFLPKRFDNDGSIIQTKHATLIQSFTGILNTVQQGYSNNNNEIEIKGEDLTKFLRLSVINRNPSLAKDFSLSPDQASSDNLSIWGDIFKGLTPPEIIELLCLGSANSSAGHKTNKIDAPGVWQRTQPGVTQSLSYDVTTKIIKVIKVEDGKTIEKPIISMREILGKLFAPGAVHIINPYKKSPLTAFNPYELSIGANYSLYKADFKPRRDIAYEVAENTHFVFYADRKGHIWFHPPHFSNGYILGAPIPEVYVVRTEDIVSYGFVEDDSNIFSAVYVTTDPPLGQEGTTELGFYVAAYRDESVLLKYGQRLFVNHNPLIQGKRGDKSQSSIRLYAKSLLQRLLASKYQGQITIVGRAEIDPGRPIYIPMRNMVYYVETISHSLNFGNGYTTTLSLSYGRKPWELLPEMLTYADNDEVYMTDAYLHDTNNQISDSKETDVPGGLREGEQGPPYEVTPKPLDPKVPDTGLEDYVKTGISPVGKDAYETLGAKKFVESMNEHLGRILGGKEGVKKE